MPENTKPAITVRAAGRSDRSHLAGERSGIFYSIDRNGVVVNLQVFDLAAARQYFAGVEGLAKEAQRTSNPRVIKSALQVMSLQPANATRLMGGSR